MTKVIQEEQVETEGICPNCQKEHKGLYSNSDYDVLHCGCFYEGDPKEVRLHVNQFVMDAETATAQSYATTNVITGSGWGCPSPFVGAGIVATGSSQLAGLLVEAETNRGEIAHALQISIDARFAKPGHSDEAINGDGRNSNGMIQEGQRLAIPAQETMPTGLSPLGQKVFRAYQKYGAYVVDIAENVTHLRAQANAYDQPTISVLQRDLARVLPSLQRVRNDQISPSSCSDVNRLHQDHR